MTYVVKLRVGRPLMFEILANKTHDFARCFLEEEDVNSKANTVWCYWNVVNINDGSVFNRMISCSPGNPQDLSFCLEECDYFVSMTRYNKANPNLFDSFIDTSHLHIVHLSEEDAFWKGRQYLDSDD